jgi:hypothetical protein
MSLATALRDARGQLTVAALVLVLAWQIPSVLAQSEATDSRFRILEASTRLVEEVYLLDARVAFDFTPEAIEALESGVPLVVELQIEVYEPRDMLWDSSVATLYQRLADRYLLTNLSTGELGNHTSLASALTALGRLRDFPMLDRRLLRVGVRYGARLRASLDVEALPLPLRPVAYLSSAWDLTSEWHDWLLTP